MQYIEVALIGPSSSKQPALQAESQSDRSISLHERRGTFQPVILSGQFSLEHAHFCSMRVLSSLKNPLWIRHFTVLASHLSLCMTDTFW